MTMKVIADQRRRVTLPEPVHPGDVFDVEQESEDRFVLTKQKSVSQAPPKLVNRDGLLLLTSSKQIGWEETRKAMDEFP